MRTAHPWGCALNSTVCARSFRVAYYQEEVDTILVKDHMSCELETVGPDEQIIDVALSMLDHKHRRRPVVDPRGNLLGQLTCRQLLKGVKDLDLPEDWREN